MSDSYPTKTNVKDDECQKAGAGDHCTIAKWHYNKKGVSGPING